MDKPVLEASDQEVVAWAVTSADVPPLKSSLMPLVTWIGQISMPTLRSDDGTVPRLHFLIVDHLIGVGFVVAGWFADPLAKVATISVDGATGETLDLFTQAIVLTDRHQMQGFGVPRITTAKFGFVLLVPEGPPGKTDGLYLRLRLVTGDSCDSVVPQVGDVSDLGNILADVSVDYALRIIKRLLNARGAGNGPSQRLPERLEGLAAQIHQWIDPRRDYGTQLTHTRANCHVDVAIRVGTMGMLVAGWLVPDHMDSITEIAVVSLFGRRVILDTPLPMKSRPDVLESEFGEYARIDCGYAAFVAIDGLDRLDGLWFLEVIMAGGAIKRVPFVCPAEPPPLQGIEAAVMLAEVRDNNLPDLYERAIAPAVEWFWSQTRRPGLASSEMIYGKPPCDPKVSVIVPVYGRIDFVRHQIARFSNDPDFSAEAGMIELIYVLDDPAKAAEFNKLCRFLYDVYGVPFRTLSQNMNLGYSAANNAGAAIAKGSLLLLLNSDVFPKQPHWVGRLAKTYDTIDPCGVLGCRLLFEDGSIQHAGMNFSASRVMQGCWENDHPARGLSAAFDVHASPEAVPAVTGACLMIDRALFDKVGGMSEAYVIADFEDSDLCLRVQEQGLKVYYTPEVELYHLERQSMRLINHGNAWARQSLTLYNMWKHSRRWGELIPKVLDEFALPFASEVTGCQPIGSSETVAEELGVVPAFDQTVGVKSSLNASPVQSLKDPRQPIAEKRRSRRKV